LSRAVQAALKFGVGLDGKRLATPAPHALEPGEVAAEPSAEEVEEHPALTEAPERVREESHG